VHRPRRVLARLLVLLLLPALLPACGTDPGPYEGLRGQGIEVLATWTGTEQEHFLAVLQAFEERTGVEATYVPAPDGVPVLLAERLAADSPPHVAFLPQPGLLRELVADGRLLPLETRARDAVGRHFSPTFRALASVGGQEYGVWFKAANKSLVWYDVAAFERLGAVPPRDLDGLLALARRLAAEGAPPFAVSGASGWTITDWFENLHARVAGLDAYDDLTAHRVPWTDGAVISTLEVLGELLAPEHVAGGLDAAMEMDFADSVEAVFGDPPRAAMVSEGDFVAGVLPAGPDVELGVDADVFPFPAGPDGAAVVVGGGDVAVQMLPSPAAAALLHFLATPEAAAVWAAVGGFVSPNLDLDLSVYPDDVTRTAARRLLEAGDAFRFDLSDLQPASFGGSEEAGMVAELRRFLLERDAEATAGRLEDAARRTGAGAS
jgi:alpha-glucoside transport system substrate-binding protein